MTGVQTCALPISADGLLTAPFPIPQSRYEPFAPTEFQCVADPEVTLRFDQPGEVGFELMTVEGAMRRLRATTGVRTLPREPAAEPNDQASTSESSIRLPNGSAKKASLRLIAGRTHGSATILTPRARSSASVLSTLATWRQKWW